MSEIATLEKLELHLAQVATTAATQPALINENATEIAPVMSNGRQGSHLELFFSEVQYSTFVSRKQLDPKVRQAKTSSNSGEGRLSYSPRLS